MAYLGATAIGLIVGTIIGLTSDYFTNDAKPPVRAVANASKSGPAFTILSGFSYGLLSALPSLIGIAVTALISYYICEPLGSGYGMFGISMSALGMLSIVGMIISNDAYGPIVDNAAVWLKWAALVKRLLHCRRTGFSRNTVKAVTKGFSISAQVLRLYPFWVLS